MPRLPWDDLDAFLNADEFAVHATVRLQEGGTRIVRGIFDDPYLNAQLGEYEADTSEPRISGKETDLAGVRRGDVVTVAGETFDVMTSPQPDGTGWALVTMARQDAAL